MDVENKNNLVNNHEIATDNINEQKPSEKKDVQTPPKIKKPLLTKLANFFLVMGIIGIVFNLIVAFSFVGVVLYVIVLALFLFLTLFATYPIIFPLLENVGQEGGFTDFLATLSVASPYVAYSSTALCLAALFIFIFKKPYIYRKSKIITSSIILAVSIAIAVASYYIQNYVEIG